MDLTQIKALNNKLEGKSSMEVLDYVICNYGDKIAFATSLGLEDQIITHKIHSLKHRIKTFTLDTGRLFPETYELIDKTRSRYKLDIQVYFPDAAAVEKMVSQKGVNLFYESVENRKQCCGVRKVEPLKRALSGFDFWISGLRKQHSPARSNNKTVEWDATNSLVKINPLIDWSTKECWDYIKEHNIPYNSLHNKGFLSIGCQPCTRAIEDGEDIRSGRWWWESSEAKECGLHKR